MRIILSSLLVCGAAATVVLAAQNPMRPGNWETTMKMEMPGMPAGAGMPPMKSTQCITAAELTKDPATGLPRGAAGQKNCTVSDYKATGNVVSWKMACTGQMAMTGTGELTFKGDSYEGVMKMSMAQGEMTMHMAGKRAGDCPEP
jgi:hypothetical protein